MRLAMWSGPRNISTAMMRSWENRPDTKVVDEPLYAYYLNETGLSHPVRDEVIAAGETSWQSVVADLTAPVQAPYGVYYQKQMTHHLIPQLPRDWIAQLTNVLLIRDPDEVAASYVRSRTEIVAEDIGLVQEAELFDQLGGTPPVIDAADFLRGPEAYSRWLCEFVGVGFSDAMLHWPPGPRDSDGVWAPHWYSAVLASTGFEPYRRRPAELHGPALEAARVSRPHYERLHAVRVVL
ncbi:HAD family hydrolase [uncultured Jatrophihabitans sp.]|uniref:sulfotransferase-like domain-containing protein n=1 Tax=uncultured Jatrophihabitans sp. TaxID=1610747 RepID=UPI0035CB1CD3